jgi:hypothetical protein
MLEEEAEEITVEEVLTYQVESEEVVDQETHQLLKVQMDLEAEAVELTIEEPLEEVVTVWLY